MTVAYRYSAARPDGAIVRGTIEADSSGGASVVLANRGLFPIALAQVPLEQERRPVASRKDLAIVFRGIAALVAAGVPLEKALASTEPLASGALREALGLARTRLRGSRARRARHHRAG